MNGVTWLSFWAASRDRSGQPGWDALVNGVFLAVWTLLSTPSSCTVWTFLSNHWLSMCCMNSIVWTLILVLDFTHDAIESNNPWANVNVHVCTSVYTVQYTMYTAYVLPSPWSRDAAASFNSSPVSTWRSRAAPVLLFFRALQTGVVAVSLEINLYLHL